MSTPNFICIGAQKGGTGWLYEQLRAHPDFWMPPVKELHYFDREWRKPRPGTENRFEKALSQAADERDRTFLTRAAELFRHPEISFLNYAALFGSAGQLITGDVTPGYSILPEECVELVMSRFPQVQIIFLARDPVERAWSQLSMWIRHGRLERFDPTNAEAVMQNMSHPDVLSRSFPSRIVALWKRFVPESQFHLFFFDDLKRAPDEVRQSVIERLGGDPAKASGKLPASYNAKARLEKMPLMDTIRQRLAKFFREELIASAKELGGPAREWPAKYGF